MLDEPDPIILEADEPAATSLQAWLELFRLPNVFTAMADVLLGFLLVHESLAPWWSFALLLAASSLMYTAGMALNDVFDAAIDRAQRPARPIPSGRVPLALALQIGGVMLGAGLALGWAVSAIEWQPRSGLVATALAAAVLGYDRILKRTVIAPAVMGSCRFLNVLLGASAGSVAWHSLHWVVAVGIGVYITGVTWFARTEAQESRRLHLAAATCVMALGLALLACFPALANRARSRKLPKLCDRHRHAVVCLVGRAGRDDFVALPGGGRKPIAAARANGRERVNFVVDHPRCGGLLCRARHRVVDFDPAAFDPDHVPGPLDLFDVTARRAKRLTGPTRSRVVRSPRP